MSRPERVVIAGAGPAGLRTAERLRELDFEGEIVLIGSETDRPYHRPALSKQFLQGALGRRRLTLETYGDLGAIWLLGTTVTGLDQKKRKVRIASGEEISFDGLVIATGVEARRLDTGLPRNRQVIAVRRVEDTLALQESLVASKRPVVVLGTGFTGCEIASTLCGMEREVVIVGRGDHLMGKALGPELGTQLTRLHRVNGVRVELGREITRWQRVGDDLHLELSDGRTIVAASLVVAIGSVPAIRWLDGSDIPVDEGVLCGPTCHVDDAEDIVAAGDVAQWQNLRYDAVPRRVEHWTNATEMGRAAADALYFGRHAAPPFMPIPRFWSEQHGIQIQGAGMPSLGTHRLTLWESYARDKSITGYLRGGQVVGVVGLNCPTEFLRMAEEELDRPYWAVPSSGDGPRRLGPGSPYGPSNRHPAAMENDEVQQRSFP